MGQHQSKKSKPNNQIIKSLGSIIKEKQSSQLSEENYHSTTLKKSNFILYILR